MSNFDLAIAKVLQNEGAYEAPSPLDPGGETYCGISRANWSNWPGWPIIDTYKGSPEFPKSLAGVAGLNEMVKSFYFKNFWHFDGISNADVAEKALDLSVNLGSTGIKVLQFAVRFVSGKAIAADGGYGPETELALNQCPPDALLNELRAQQAYHYAQHAKPQLMLGLLRRAVK